MSLDFYLEETKPCEVFWANITHNLAPMAREAGIYDCLWRPGEEGFQTARQVAPILERGLVRLLSDPKKFKKLDSPNGFGTYEGFVKFVEKVLAGCRENPDTKVRVSA